MTLAAFKGKVALVNLWATWCAPCRQEMPALDRLQAALGGDDFAVVPVSIDIGGRDRPAAFLKQIGVKNLPLYTDRTTEIFEGLKTRGLAIGLPVTVLLDRNGCRLGHINGPAEWDSEDGKRLIEAAIEAAVRNARAEPGDSLRRRGRAADRVFVFRLLQAALHAVAAADLGPVEGGVGALQQLR